MLLISLLLVFVLYSILSQESLSLISLSVQNTKKGLFKQHIFTKLEVKQWYEDDLPNILGINPIEAAIIFGALYYYYGPNTLYEYAREAGKLFSTYAPIVKGYFEAYQFISYLSIKKMFH